MSECASRIGEDSNDKNSVFNRINDVFDWLPLAALIDNEIVCVHGGIGVNHIKNNYIKIIRRLCAK